MEKGQLEERVDKLEDSIVEKLSKQVEEIHRIIVGNGSEGLLTTTKLNKQKIKILFWLVSIILAALLGGNLNSIKEKITGIRDSADQIETALLNDM